MNISTLYLRSLRVVHFIAKLVIFLSLCLPATHAAGSAAIPAACKRDSGNIMLPGVNGWLFIVNFNEIVAGGVQGCMILTPGGQLVFVVFTCNAIGNLVLDGSSVLLSGGYLDCPFDISMVAGNAEVNYDTFLMAANVEATSTNQTGQHSNPLFHHPSASFFAPTTYGILTTTTQLGAVEFGSAAKNRGDAHSIVSSYQQASLRHYQDQVLINAMDMSDTMAFDATPTHALIGRHTSALVPPARIRLFELVVDPAGHCC